MRFDRGRIALVLDAHTAFASSGTAEGTASLQHFFAEITQSYLPLLNCLDELARQEVPYRLTISFSPTLLQMIGDPGYQVAYDRYLDEQLALDQPLARKIQTQEAARLWRDVYQGRIAGGFAGLHRSGHLELLATSATRACLPLLAATPGALEAQIHNGVIEYRRLFRATPSGFWLPQTAFAPGLDDLLIAEGLQYTFVEQETLSAAGEPAPLSVRCPSGLRAYGLNRTLAERIAHVSSGYPETPVFFNAAGRTSPYDGDRARWVAGEQAREFAEALQTEVVKHGHLSREPVICCALPAAILGTAWLEGIDWLASLLRATSSPASDIRSANLSEPLPAAPSERVAYPETGARSATGTLNDWIHPGNDWIYPELHHASQHLARAFAADTSHRGLARRALVQAARELFLAQQLDLAAEIAAETLPASQQFLAHLTACHRLVEQAEIGAVDSAELAVLESTDRILPALHPRDLQPRRDPSHTGAG